MTRVRGRAALAIRRGAVAATGATGLATGMTGVATGAGCGREGACAAIGGGTGRGAAGILAATARGAGGGAVGVDSIGTMTTPSAATAIAKPAAAMPSFPMNQRRREGTSGSCRRGATGAGAAGCGVASGVKIRSMAR